MFDEDLINAVRKYRCLYYKNKTCARIQPILKKCWNNVSIETGESVERCQSRWKSLRDRFVKEHKNYVERNQVSVWKLMESLEFLRESINIRPKKCKLFVEESPRVILQNNNKVIDNDSFCSNGNNGLWEKI